jgi:hypothetical protein
MQGTFGSLGRRAAMAAICLFFALALWVSSARAAAPVIEFSGVANVTSTTALFKATINPEKAETKYRFEYGPEDCPFCSKAPVEGEGTIPKPEPSDTSPVEVSVPVSGLTPSTVYHYRVVANNGTVVDGPDHFFETFGPVFEGGLPDGRAYEQSSPVAKDGGDAQGQVSLSKATPTGDGIVFGSTVGIPGGKGAGGLPTYLAARGPLNWSSQGLLPPPSVGERTRVIGWSPDFSRIYTRAIKLTSPPFEGLVEQSSLSEQITLVGPYAAHAEYSFAGESPDGSVVFFESFAQLPPTEGGTPIAAATKGVPNLYAWDAEDEEVHLVGVFNQGEGAPKGSFAGPYDWSLGAGAINLHEGGGYRNYYLRDMHAITPAGNVYFTAAGTGQLYLRINPTKTPSPMEGGKCKNPDLACTIAVSASKRTPPDPVGEQPAAFQAASKDGSKVFFTSSEMLTNESNTGPEQPKPTISRAKLNGEAPANEVEKEFLPKRAVGVTRSGSWLYWANPKLGEIGRAKLDSEEKVEAPTVEDDFIVIPPSEGKCEEELPRREPSDPSVFKKIEGPIPAEPRYVAVDAGHIYWTNTGRRDEFETPIDGGGTIGRAKLNGEGAADKIEPAFICGEDKAQPNKKLVSNPQGIAVDAEHIYWANAGQFVGTRSIARAKIDGSEVKEDFVGPLSARVPYGVAVSSTDLYFDANNEDNNASAIFRTTLAGTEEEGSFTGEEGLRGVAVDSGHLYWATKGEGGKIGRSDLDLENVEKTFIDVEGAPAGIATGTSHLFWSINGETPGNPGNDLYRYEPNTKTLKDLTVLGGGNGAEVQGVLGVSGDGSYIYFAANAVLAGTAAEGATQGTCKGSVKFASGQCNLYAWHEGQVHFIAPLNASRGDALNWVGTPTEALFSNSFAPKTSYLSEDGEVLVFRSREELTEYDSEGVPEFYRYRVSEPGKLSCITCPPSGASVSGGPSTGSIVFPSIQPANLVQSVSSRNLSADGNHFFFETPEALTPLDTNGAGKCLPSGEQNFPACMDVYEWEAPGTGQCEEGGPSFGKLDGGCVYLISTGKSKYPSLFGDASEDGSSVFFFTRERLVGQDEDELQDVYDARINGGLAAQNQITPPPCESTEACHGPEQAPPVEGTPSTESFVGPGNVVEKHKKPKAKKKKKKKSSHHKHNKKQRRANTEAGGGR